MLNVKKKKKIRLIVLGIVLTIFCWLVHSYLASVLEVFPNLGISFSIYCSLLLVVAFLALVAVVVLFWREGDFGLMIVSVGGVINFIDRLVFGYVRDYWRFGFVYNNLADWIIVGGVLYSLVRLWKEK